MQQSFDKLLMFRNRLAKVYKHVGKVAAKAGVTCYRVYDHDLPEAPFIIERYEDKLYVSEYKRRHGMEDEAHKAWLEACKDIMSEVIGVAREDIFVKLRKRKEGRGDQYQKVDERKSEFVVHEGGLQFMVNLSDYLDTGLFLDHRITRNMVKEGASGKRVLNLFCYTGSFSVYAIAGGAAQVTSVDLSKTYLAWAERNVAINFPAYKEHEAVHADVLQYLKSLPEASYDLIVMDPPTFSNSKRMEDFLDIQRDHGSLINDCLRALAPGGVLFFSTNYTKFQLDASSLQASAIKDITKATTPFDFAGKLNRYCFKLEK
jgi:23S rRNA (cytosine1962-C5)-methyltransferase